MAGDWIKIEKATPRKPEVVQIAAQLGVRPDEAFGLCFRFWSWCDDHLVSSIAPGVTTTMIDTVMEYSGFAKALIVVGWLRVAKRAIEIPNFDRHLSDSAKRRGLAQRRMHVSRSQDGDAASATQASREKRKEKKRTKDTQKNTDASPSACVTSTDKSASRSAFVPPTVNDVARYCAERNNHVDAQNFVDFYSSKNWMIGRNKMSDWKASVRTWERAHVNTTSNGNDRFRVDRSLDVLGRLAARGDDGGSL